MIATQNTPPSLYSILTYQIKFYPPIPAIQFSRIFQPPRLFQPPTLFKFWKFFYTSPHSPPPFAHPMFIPTPLLVGTQEYVPLQREYCMLLSWCNWNYSKTQGKDIFHVVVDATKLTFSLNRPSFFLWLFFWFYNCYIGYIPTCSSGLTLLE